MLSELRAVVLDWAGVVMDFGCQASVDAFVAVFKAEGVLLAPAEARLPMGLGKAAHLTALFDLPGVAARWRAVKGAPPTPDDTARLLAALEPAFTIAAAAHSDLIPGVVQTCRDLRRAGLSIGVTTGYTRRALEPLLAAAHRQGFEPDAVVCAGETARGRPHPDPMLEVLHRLDLTPEDTCRCVKVDDAASGLREGRAAGAWAIGVSLSGAAAGLSRDALRRLDHDSRLALRRAAEERLDGAGAHAVIDTVVDLVPVLERLARRLPHGDRP